MAGGEMQLQLAHGDGKRFDAPRTLAVGASELGRVDLATWGADGFLVSRVRQADGAPELVVDELDAAGAALSSTRIAAKVGGFPRMARRGDVVLLAWAQAGASPGTSTVGMARLTPSATPAP
jgi:hypothetical protein